MKTRTTLLAGAACLTIAVSVSAGEPLPQSARKFIGNYCLDCRDAASNEGRLNLEIEQVAWSDRNSIQRWTKVFDMLDTGDMPPADAEQPKPAERQAMLAWIDKVLTENDRPGGTVLRRLNRAEYENSVRAALGVPFKSPAGFPADTEIHGFDNIGEGLVLSPPLMEKYFEIAGTAADLLIPPPREKSPSNRRPPRSSLEVSP